MAEQRVTETDIRAVLAGTYTQEGIDIWLATANRHCLGMAPREALACCPPAAELVRSAAERVAGAM